MNNEKEHIVELLASKMNESSLEDIRSGSLNEIVSILDEMLAETHNNKLTDETMRSFAVRLLAAYSQLKMVGLARSIQQGNKSE